MSDVARSYSRDCLSTERSHRLAGRVSAPCAQPFPGAWNILAMYDGRGVRWPICGLFEIDAGSERAAGVLHDDGGRFWPREVRHRDRPAPRSRVARGEVEPDLVRLSRGREGGIDHVVVPAVS